MQTTGLRIGTGRVLGYLIATLWLMLVAGAALAAAGRVVFVAGDVRAEGAATRPLAAGDTVEVGETIVTGERSRAQLLMADGARLALRAGTRYRIDALTLPADVAVPGQARAVATDGSSVATLLKGGFRTATGSIGKQDPAAYEVRTPVGVLGIRGTEYVAVLCQGDCADAPGVRPGEVIRDGLYIGVFRNGIVFRAPGQPDRVAGPGEFLFIPLTGGIFETLTDPPAFLEADGYGRLDLAGGAAPDGRARPQEVPGLSTRRSPGDADKPADASPGRSDDTPSLPVGGTDAQGNPVDLTPGNIPRFNDISYSIGDFNDGGLLVGAATGTPTTILLGGSGVTQFPGQVLVGDTPTAATFAIGTSSNTNTGSGAGLSWGRWSGGVMTVSGSGFPTINQSLAGQSLHWIIHEFVAGPPALPITGAVPFQLAGATTPTSTAGQAGVLVGAGLVADFTAATLDLTLGLTIGGLDWYGAGRAGLTGGNRFEAAINTGSVGGTVLVGGSFAGFLSEPAGSPGSLAAGISYSLFDLAGAFPAVTGVLGFGPGPGQPLPPPLARRDVAFATAQLGQFPAFVGVAENAPGQYELDAALNLNQFFGPFPLAGAPVNGTYSRESSTVLEGSLDTATLLRWGRWSGGQATFSDGGTTEPVDLLSSSLHWVVSANAANPPVLPATGTVSYTLIGGTTPTNNFGQSGALGSATFLADFTNNTVESNLSLGLGQNQWDASGIGVIGAQAGLPAHQFLGIYDVLITGPQTDIGSGVFNGFFSRPGGTDPAVPGGVGLSYFLANPDFSETIQGIAILQAP